MRLKRRVARLFGEFWKRAELEWETDSGFVRRYPLDVTDETQWGPAIALWVHLCDWMGNSD